MKKLKIFPVALFIPMFSFMALMAASVAFAQPSEVAGGEEAGPGTVDDLLDLIGQIAVYFQTIVLIIAVIMLVAAGFTWMTAGGDEEKLTKARKMFIWGLVGIAIALFAFIAQSFIEDLINR